MKKINHSFDRKDLIEKLKIGDERSESLIRDFKSDLHRRYPADNVEVFSQIAQAYEEAGLLEKAKNAYYTAKTYADKGNNRELEQKLLEKVRSLPGDIDD